MKLAYHKIRCAILVNYKTVFMHVFIKWQEHRAHTSLLSSLTTPQTFIITTKGSGTMLIFSCSNQLCTVHFHFYPLFRLHELQDL